MGTFGLVISFAPAIGPTLSGWIVDHLPWQAPFVLMLPIALASIIFANVTLRNVTERTQPRLDGLSVALCTVAFGRLLLGLRTAGLAGCSSPQVLIAPAVG